MHIEKISDHKIKFILSKEDLVNKDLKFSELAYGSDKAQSLFMDMMEQAYEKFGFDSQNIPLMIEAIPLEEDSVIIIVTKVASSKEIDDKFEESAANSKVKKAKKPSRKTRKTNTKKYIYLFDSFEDVILASQRLNNIYIGNSSLFTIDRQYYLILSEHTHSLKEQSMLEATLSEYGRKILQSPIIEGWLNERAEKMIENTALNTCYKYFK